jgi:hypothetical protein
MTLKGKWIIAKDYLRGQKGRGGGQADRQAYLLYRLLYMLHYFI